MRTTLLAVALVTSLMTYRLSAQSAASLSVQVNVDGADLNSIELWKNGAYETAVDPSGNSYTFNGLVSGQSYRADAYATDMLAGSTGTFTAVSGSNSKSISAPSQGTVTVTVYYSDGSTPRPSVSISLVAHSGRSWRTCTSGTDGKCSMSAYPNRSTGETWTLQASGASNTAVTLSAGGSTTRSMTTSTAPPSASLAVTVSGVTGADLNSIELWKNGAYQTSVDPSGTSYTFNGLVPGQSYRADAYATDMLVGNTGTFTAASGTNSKTITAPAQGTVGVTVYYSDGTSRLKDAIVSLVAHTGKTWRTCTTDANGSCTLSAYPNTSSGERWTLRTSSAPDVAVTLTAASTTSRSMTTTIPPPVTPASIAVTVNGVTAGDLNSLELFKGGVFQTRVLNPGSPYTFTGLAAGESYRVDAYATDMLVGNTGTFTTVSGTNSKSITAPAQGTVAATVYYSDGTTRLKDAIVSLVSHTQRTWRTCTTDVNGSCTLTGYPNASSGETWVLRTSSAPDVAVNLTAGGSASRSMTTTITPPSASLAVTVNGVAAADLNSLELFKNGVFQTRVLNPGSPYTFTNLTAGESYRVDAYATDMLVGNTGTFTAVSGPNSKTITAPAQGTVGVTVYYSDGTSRLKDAIVSLVAHTGKTWRTCTTDANGSCTLTAYPNTLSGERWTLRTSSAPDVAVTLTAASTTSRSMTTTIPPPVTPASIAVTVNGVTAGDLNSLELFKGGVFQTRVLNPGSPYTFTGLAAGESYRVDAYATDMLVGNTGTFTTVSGTNSKSITAPAQGTVAATVYYSDGTTRLKDAIVSLVSHTQRTWRTCTTDVNGSCTLTGYPNASSGETWVLRTSSAPDVAVNLTAGGSASRSMTTTITPPSASLAVTVNGVAAADLNSLELFKNGVFQTRVLNPGSPYTFTNLTAGESYRVDAYATDMLVGNTGTFTAVSGTNSKSITAPGQGTVVVTVYYSDGTTKLPGATVSLTAHSGRTWRTCTTDANGTCTLTAYPNTPPGETWTLRTQSASDVSVSLAANTTTSRSITTTAPPRTELAVGVTGANGADLNSIELWKNGVYQTSVDPIGTSFTFTGLEAGQSYRADAYATDMLVGSSGTFTAVGGLNSKTIAAPGQGTVGVTVYYSDGTTTLIGATVSLVAHSRRTWRTCTTGADGTCTLSAYPNTAPNETWTLRTGSAPDVPVTLAANTSTSRSMKTDRVPPQPDLLVTALSGAPTEVAPGATLNVTFTVANQGTAGASGIFSNEIKLSGNTSTGLFDGTSIGNVNLSGLAAGTSVTQGPTPYSVPATVPEGSYFLKVMTDSVDSVPELGNESNNIGVFTSPIVVKKACTPPSVTSQPQDVTISAGQSATLAVVISGTTPATYQWYRGPSGDASTPVGTNSSSYTTQGLTATAKYWVRISNACGSASSNTATVMVAGDPPRAAFTWSPASPQVGESVQFTDTSSGSPTSFHWNFGDGGSSTAANPAHVYQRCGSFAVTHTAANGAGTSAPAVQNVEVGSSTRPVVTFFAEPASIKVGESARLRWTTSGAISVSIDHGLGSRPVNGEVMVTPGATTTYTLTAEGGCGRTTSSATVAVSGTNISTLSFGGIVFSADKVDRVAGGYRLSGVVTLNGVLSYSGELTVKDRDVEGNYSMEGTGQLRLPSVVVPGVGAVILYDGDFKLPFKDGVVGAFLEDKTQIKVAGWKFRIDSVRFLSDGITAQGSIRIPQYVPRASAIGASASINATKSGGLKLNGGSVRIDKIALAGGFALQDVDISYDGEHDIFDGSGTLKTPTLGVRMGVQVVQGCPNSATVTIKGVPIALGATGVLLINYGVDAANLCGDRAFGIGLHTDVMLAAIPDPDLFSLSRMQLMYFPLTSLRGGGTLRLLKTDVGDAQLFLNYSDPATGISCSEALCFTGVLALPNIHDPWLYGRVDGRISLNPVRLSAAQRMIMQVPESCWTLDLPFAVQSWACPILATYCGKNYPCVLGEAATELKAEPGADPEATLTSKVSVYGHSWDATLTYNERGDKDYHLRFGSRPNDASLLDVATNGTGGTSQVMIGPNTPDAYVAVRGPAGVAPDASITSPSGVRYGPQGGADVAYYEDREHGAGVFALRQPQPGAWTVSVGRGTTVVNHTPNRAPSILFRQIASAASGHSIIWSGSDPDGSATVVLTYAVSYDGPDAGVIAEKLPATGSDQTLTWSSAGVPPGSYYVRARITDDAGSTATVTWPAPLSVAGGGGLEAPSNVSAVVQGALVRVRWDADSSASAAGYGVFVRAGSTAAPVEYFAGGRVELDLIDLDPRKGYDIWVVAYDRDGRRGRPSTLVAVSWMPCSPAITADVPTIATAGDTIAFASSANLPGCTGATRFEWKFGDGASGGGPRTTHVYRAPGTYPWSLIVEAGDTKTEKSGTIVINRSRCSLVVTSPSHGAVLKAGTPMTLTWTEDGVCGREFQIELMKGSEVLTTIAPSAAGLSLPWTPPPLAGGDFHIKITDRANAAGSAVSQPFSITTSNRRRAADR